MALVVSSIAGDDKQRKSSFRAERRPWMLKDYLRDDMSSCSSNGFRSFPRRQCCVAVRNIIEKEVKHRRRSNHSEPKRLVRNRSVSEATFSALQRASVAVVNAFKLLPFKSPAESVNGAVAGGKRFLPRSFSKKLFKRSFWKKSAGGGGESKVEKEEVDVIERWISSGVVGSQKYQPLDLSNDTTVTNASTTSNSNSDGKSDSWSDITVTSSWDYYLSSSSDNDTVETTRKKSPLKDEDEVSKTVAATAVEDSIKPAAVTKNTWQNEEVDQKEQFSPVSVLDFLDSNEGSSSPFTHRVTRLKGTKERLMKKLGKFECLTRIGLEPVNLESLISSKQLEDHDDSPKFSIQSCSTPSYIISSESEVEEEEEEEESQANQPEKKVEELLDLVKDTILSKSTYKFEVDNILLDFFKENAIEKPDEMLLKTAEDWVNGHYNDDLLMGWKVKDKRQAYIRDMEEGGRWPKNANLEKQEVVIELETEILGDLVEELLVEYCS